ncbi:MAG: RDD family protein [Kiritimatiellaeota bacterium]|nr:RDD family protein [Kiritimatiellota bacterium]
MASQGAPYAGGWRRLAAFVIDFVLLVIVLVCIAEYAGAMAFGISLCLCWLYSAGWESSPLQATPGKWAVGLSVVDTNGGRISFLRATGRYAIGKLPLALHILLAVFHESVSIGAGFCVMAYYFFFLILSIILDEQRQGLHDCIAKTRVVQPDVSPLRNGIHSVVTCIVWAFFLFSCSGVHLDFGSSLQAYMTAVGARGKDIYFALSEIPPVGQDKTYTTSTDYFNDLLAATDTIDCSKFSGAGVRTPLGGAVMTASNNMWSVLVNVTDDDSIRLPLFITRNIDTDALNRALRDGITKKDFSTRVKFSTVYNTPFDNKGVVLIRRDGTVTKLLRKQITLGTLFGETEIPPRPESAPPLIYLRP